MRGLKLGIALAALLGMGLGCNPETKATDAAAPPVAEPPKASQTAVSGKPAVGAKEVTTATGLRYTDVVIGDGPMPKPGQTVRVHYTGTLMNGTKFDSSFDHPDKQPIEFPLGAHAVIEGWDEGIATMKVGGKRKLVIPPMLAYKDQAMGDKIPANSTLKFDVELVGVQ